VTGDALTVVIKILHRHVFAKAVVKISRKGGIIVGKAIISGNGRDYVKLTNHNWVIFFVIAGAIVGLGFLLANQFGYQTAGGVFGDMVGGILGGILEDATGFGLTTPQVRTGTYYLFVGGGITLAVLLLAWRAIQDMYAAKTEIYVYEDGVKGFSVGPKFAQSLGDTMAVSSFHLEYDNISFVDITPKKLLSLNAFGKVYLIAVDNATEIMNVINEKLRKPKVERPNTTGSNVSN